MMAIEGPGEREVLLSILRDVEHVGMETGVWEQGRVLDAVERIISVRQANAWDEGYLRGVLDQESELERADNPYRAPLLTPSFRKSIGTSIVADYGDEEPTP